MAILTDRLPKTLHTIGLVLVAIGLSLELLACGSGPQPQAPIAPQQPQAQPAWPQQAPPAQPAWPQQAPPVSFNLVGIWEAQIPTEYGIMYTQMILQPNGSYSYQVILGDLMTWETGFYEVGSGYIHFTLQNYGPTTYKGTELSRPMSWSVFYTVVDADTMVWEDRVLGSQWTVRRRR
jgi:hypothetical protein